MTRLLRRLRRNLGTWILAFATFLAVYLIGCSITHADTGPSDPALRSSSPGGWDLSTWVMLGLAALGGVRTIVDALLAFFKAEAPLTKATWDDRARDSLQRAHDKLDKLAGTVNGLVEATRPLGGVRVLPGPGTAAMLAVLLLGALAAPVLTGCTASQRSAAVTTAKVALINCTAQPLGTTPGLDIATLAAVINAAAAERLKCTPPGQPLDWKCVERDLIGEGATIGGCAFVKLVADALAAIRPAGSGLVAGDPAPPPGRVELERFRAAVAEPGVALTFHTATGDL